MSDRRLLTGRIEDDSRHVFLFACVLSEEDRLIHDSYAVAGGEPVFHEYSFPDDIREFQSWAKDQEFRGRAEPGRSGDIDRFLAHIKGNLELTETVVDLALAGDMDTLRFDLQAELEATLGHGDFDFDLQVSKQQSRSTQTAKRARSGPDLTGRLPMSCVIAPISGVAISRLPIGEKIRVRFSDLTHAPTRQYMKDANLDVKSNRVELDATIRSLESIPGSGHVVLLMDLPGGAKAYAREEDTSLRIRMAGDKKVDRQKDSRPGESPLLLAGIVAVAAVAGVAMYFLLA